MTLSTTERAASHRAKRKAEGWTNLNCWLPPGASKVLADAIKEHPDKTRAQLIIDALYVYRQEGMTGPDFTGF